MNENIKDLIPLELQDKIPKLYETEEQEDPIAYIKLFTPDSNWTWYITELSIDKNICFGYVVSAYDKELGYFSLEEILQLKGDLGLKVEKDLSFKETRLSAIRREYD